MGPARFDALRDEYFGLLREAIEPSGGREFLNTGDGMMAAFASASAAVRCAVLTQQLFERRYRGQELRLRLRIGLATGEATVSDGEYLGMPAVEATRLCDKAPTDGILVSPATRLLASRVDGAQFESVGELELKGIPEPVEAFAVHWEPLQHEAYVETLTWPLPSLLRSVPRLSYVGRVGERDMVERARKATRDGRRSLVLVSGEPGIGKTRLAAYEALGAHQEGFAVLWGSCSEDLAVPYEPWIEVCSQLVEHAPEDLLAGYVAEHGAGVGRVAGNLARRLPDAPAPQSSDPETERLMLFKAVAELLRTAAQAQPVCVVLDDFHWADGQSVALLKHVARTVGQDALQILVTYRDTDLVRDHPLTAALADLRRVEGVERVALSGLGPDEVAELLGAVAGHDLDGDGLTLAREISVETDGNPFFVGEILRNMTESGALAFDERTGRWHIERSAITSLPPSVRDVVTRRVDRLGDDARRVLTTAAVVGRSFDVEVLARILDRSEDDLLDLLDIAIESSIVVEQPDRLGRFSFTHALINDTLYEGLMATRRARVHRQVAEALEDLCGEDPGERAAELATHWSRAVIATDRAKAVGYARQAGEQALAQLAPDEALRWFHHALELLGPDATSETRCELLTGVGRAQKHAGDAAFRETLLKASRIARDAGWVRLLVQATLENSRGWVARSGEVDGERVEMLEAAVAAAPPDSADVPVLRAQLASELAFADDWPRVSTLVDEALATARERGDLPTLARVLNWACPAMLASIDTPRRMWDLTEELEGLATELGDPGLRWTAAWIRHVAAIMLGDVDEVDRANVNMSAVADQLGQPVLQWAAAYHECVRQLLRGDTAAVEAAAYHAAGLGHEIGQPDAAMIAGVQLFQVRAEQGRVDELIEILEQRVAEFPGLPVLQAMIGIAYIELGRIDDAREVFERAAADGFRSLPRDVTWLNAVGRFAEIAARLDAEAAAARLYDLLLPYRDRLVTSVITVSGSVERPLGLLAATLGRWDAAEDHFTKAVEVHERMGARMFLARTLMNHGRVLMRRGRDEDRARATDLLERAVALAGGLGGAAIVRDATAVLEQSADARADA